MASLLFEHFKLGNNILLHGPSGVGKSYIMKELINSLKYTCTEDEIAVLAPTGVAAVNISGQTIHSYFGVRIAKLPNNKTQESMQEYMKLITSKPFSIPVDLKYVFIDEISMVGKILFDAMDIILRRKFNENLPMGGIQFIMSGDFYQLPPVRDDFCFESENWQQMQIVQISDMEPKRYINAETFDLMKRLRKAQHTKDDIRLLNSRKKAYKDEYEELQNKAIIEIYSYNADIAKINDCELKKLKTQKYTFLANDTINLKVAESYKYIESKAQATLEEIMPQELQVKVGAKVILVRNYAIDRNLVNGRTGIIENIYGDCDAEEQVITVRFSNDQIEDISRILLENNTRKYSCSRYQFPLKLAWAISIHKTQSMTIESAIVDLSNTFTDGQSYVAISRITDINNLYIKSINFNKIKANAKVLEMFD